MSEEPFMQFEGIYDDDGHRYEPDSIPKPSLCVLCREDDNRHPLEEVLCLLSRLDHMLEEDEEEFICHSFCPRD
jgi:hypothetical protein